MVASAALATCSASVTSPTWHRASASRQLRLACWSGRTAALATACRSSSAAARGAWPTSSTAVPASQSGIHSSTGPEPPSRAGSSCRATRSGDAPELARARAASPCQAARTGAGISSYRAARISGCRNPSLLPDSASTPAARASASAGTRSATLRRSTVARSCTAKSTPSRAAARRTSRTQGGTKPRRSAIAADREPGAGPLVSSAASPVTDRLELRASALTSSVRYSGLPAAPSASRSRPGPGLPRTRALTSSVAAPPASPPRWRRTARPGKCRSASRSSRCGTGRMVPINSRGRCRAERASRSHRLTLDRSAHCRSSTTNTTGWRPHSSSVRASSCSPRAAGKSSPRPEASSPRSRARIVFRRGLTEGSRTRNASKKGSSGNVCPSSSPAPQKTWQPSVAASAHPARTSADFPIPGSPSISTAPPCPAVASATQRVSRVSSSSRPTRRPPSAWAGTRWIVPRRSPPEQAPLPRLRRIQEDRYAGAALVCPCNLRIAVTVFPAHAIA